jgi:general stress protein 26
MSVHHTDAEFEDKLRVAINGARGVMLGLAGLEDHHLQPMKGHAVAGEQPVWFLCRRDITLAQAVAGEARTALMTVVSEDHHLYATLDGHLVEDRDQGRIDQFWSSVADAWLPEGRTSPVVTLLRFDPVAARIWLSDNSFKLAWEVAKANFNRQPIQSGETATLRLG